MLKSLDPHSDYIPAEDFSAVNEPLEGNFAVKLSGYFPHHHRPVVAARHKAVRQPEQTIYRIDVPAITDGIDHF